MNARQDTLVAIIYWSDSFLLQNVARYFHSVLAFYLNYSDTDQVQ